MNNLILLLEKEQIDFRKEKELALESFYKNFIDNENNLIKTCVESKDHIPFAILYNIKRFIDLADNIHKIATWSFQNWSEKVFFLCTLCESIYDLIKWKNEKDSESKFKYILWDYLKKNKQDKEIIKEWFYSNIINSNNKIWLNSDQILSIIYSIRSRYAHWDFYDFKFSTWFPWKFAWKFNIKRWGDFIEKEIDINITYNDFKDITIRASLFWLKKYLKQY